MGTRRVHRDVKASGIRLRVLDVGEGAPLLFLHGLFVDHRTWSGVLDRLAPEFRSIAPDLPGFGDSEKPSASRFGYGADAFSSAIADLYGALGLGPATVVGHGVGGAIAITLASQHPELVARLVLLDALCLPPAGDTIRRAASLPLVGGFYFRQIWGRAGFRAYFRDAVLSRNSTVPLQRVDDYYGVFNTPSSRGSALATLRATKDTRPLVAHTARIQCPTLVLWGRDDVIFPARLGRQVARNIRGAGFELLHCAHAPQEEVPQDVAGLLSQFCRAERSGHR